MMNATSGIERRRALTGLGTIVSVRYPGRCPGLGLVQPFGLIDCAGDVRSALEVWHGWVSLSPGVSLSPLYYHCRLSCFLGTNCLVAALRPRCEICCFGLR